MPLTRPALILALLLPACSSPTEVVEFAQLQGDWELTLQENSACNPVAPARVIPFDLRASVSDQGVNRILGDWDFATGGYHHAINGDFDAETRELTISFEHRQGAGVFFEQVFVLEATATRNDRLSGTLLPGRNHVYILGRCEQPATARKVG